MRYDRTLWLNYFSSSRAGPVNKAKARLFLYVAVVQPGQKLEYRLLLRNNLEGPVTYEARLNPPRGWQTSSEFQSLRLEQGTRGELPLAAAALSVADNTRHLLTAEIKLVGIRTAQSAKRL